MPATTTSRRQIYALHCNVIAVARTNGVTWMAFVGPVPGFDHDDEAEHIEKFGAKLRHDLACVMFPKMSDLEYEGRR